MSDYSYMGVGPIYMRDRNGSRGARQIGNVSSLAFSVNEETKELMDYTSAGGGTRNEKRRITGVEVSITMHDLSPENLAMAMYGETSEVAAGSVVDEAVTAKHDELVLLDNVGATSVVVKNQAGDTTYTVDTDYTVTSSGIIVLSTGTIADDASLKVSYDYPAQDVVQGLTSDAGEYELIFEGINEARSGKQATVVAHRVRFGAAANLDLIGDDYAGLELTGKLLSDDSQVGDVSRFFKSMIVQ